MAVPEVVSQPGGVVPTSPGLDRQLGAERTMLRASIRGAVFAVPVSIAVLIVMMAVAIGNKTAWYVWVGLGVGLGVYAAGFFGVVGGVMLSSHLFDDIDEAAMHAEHGTVNAD